MFNLVSKSRAFSTFRAVQAPKQFVVILRDYTDPGALQRRLDTRDRHLKDALEAQDKSILNLGGAILDNHDSRKMKGSVLVISADSKEDIEKMILNDPYYDAKVWEKWEILPVNLAIGKITK
ncbi:uncharacterized protein EV154DRAFT_557802 [Mucor mucedo]|uniref:YCII-related domain-containing protein n=1 Tax=Mucor saturninus TaxID=64648 RepID=A0A8H7V7P2_9FUNG|nr:uncharacterized protein EV154DRAFT_557802 [Mucor mucedo]KAG2210290.1 hypothetical protein INT47_003275 [Mucor saturninus]KAI7897011.1 hypothetical protein EV154DRAFT_557802 [Mucor mucedo]